MTANYTIVLTVILILLSQSFTQTQSHVQPDSAFSLAQMTTAKIMQGEVVVERRPTAFDGYNMFVLREHDNVNSKHNQTLIITDMEGNVEYERILTPETLYELADLSMDFVSPTTILVGYQRDVALVNLYNGSVRYLGFFGHHDYEYNHNNNTVFVFKYMTKDINGSSYLYDRIEEHNLNGELVWSLDTSDFISPDMQCPYEDYFMGSPDMTHSNTLFYDNDEDMIYYNPRNVNTFYKIDHRTSEVIWGVGEYGNFTMYDKSGHETSHLFFHPHALERVDDNTFILFDNDHHDQNNPNNRKSRMLEITINETTMEAHESWSWTGPLQYFSFLWGDADRLPNGNRLGTFGAGSHPDTDDGPIIVEVTETGDIAWKFTFENSEEYKYGIYRTERFRYSPILESPSKIHFDPEEEVILEWQAWYDFRPKRTVIGNYSLSMSNTLIDSGTFPYDRFWRPSNLTFNLGVLEEGEYELTLQVTDEVGFTTNDTILVNVSVSSFIPVLIGVSLGVVAVLVILVIYKKKNR